MQHLIVVMRKKGYFLILPENILIAIAEILEKEQFFQLCVLKYVLVCREDYCLNNGLLLVKSLDAQCPDSCLPHE